MDCVDDDVAAAAAADDEEAIVAPWEATVANLRTSTEDTIIKLFGQ